MELTVTAIKASKDQIELSFRTGAENIRQHFEVRAFVPLVNIGSDNKHPGRQVFSYAFSLAQAEARGNDEYAVRFPRKSGYDLLICRYELSMFDIDGGGMAEAETVAEGVKYVDGFLEGFSECSDPGPEIKRPLGTWMIAPEEDIEYMRFGYMMDEIDLAWIMSYRKHENVIVHVWNGREYYFDREMVELHDSFLIKMARKGIPTLIRFINRDKYQLKRADSEFFNIIKHPCCEEDIPDVEISGFNMRTEEAIGYYCACVDFLISRYASPDSPYGWSKIIDIGNEVNAQQTWYNSGPMESSELMEEYSVALRLAWQIARQYHSDYQVHISVEHNFANTDNPDRTHFYPARDVLLHLSAITRRDSDFDWGVSAHPYPERLDYPDFYNDRCAVFSLDTHKITMKNMEVWPVFLSRPEMSYKGAQRRVLFDEQGFHTAVDRPYTEEQGAYAFVLAYLKIRKNPGIDVLLIHRHIDQQDEDEYGLHLGLRYAGPGGYTDPEHIFAEPGRRKMICDAIAAMDSDLEGCWVRTARAFIGEGLFDYLMDPPEVDPGSMGKI